MSTGTVGQSGLPIGQLDSSYQFLVKADANGDGIIEANPKTDGAIKYLDRVLSKPNITLAQRRLATEVRDALRSPGKYGTTQTERTQTLNDRAKVIGVLTLSRSQLVTLHPTERLAAVKVLMGMEVPTEESRQGLIGLIRSGPPGEVPSLLNAMATTPVSRERAARAKQLRLLGEEAYTHGHITVAAQIWKKGVELAPANQSLRLNLMRANTVLRNLAGIAHGHTDKKTQDQKLTGVEKPTPAKTIDPNIAKILSLSPTLILTMTAKQRLAAVKRLMEIEEPSALSREKLMAILDGASKNERVALLQTVATTPPTKGSVARSEELRILGETAYRHERFGLAKELWSKGLELSDSALLRSYLKRVDELQQKLSEIRENNKARTK